tara:strand:- start:473 stop:691 length:219 start_codon:yes stop_codon:yes gene_type:complete
MLVYDAILGGYNTQEDAIDYARGMVWSECEATEQNIKYADHIDTVDGVGVYYDFGADYYFFTDESEDPREQN